MMTCWFLKKNFLFLHLRESICISLHVPAARRDNPRSWSGSSVRLERQPVTLEVAGSSPVRFATLPCRNDRLRAVFLCLPRSFPRVPHLRTNVSAPDSGMRKASCQSGIFYGKHVLLEMALGLARMPPSNTNHEHTFGPPL